MGAAVISSTEYQMHMVAVIASVAKLIIMIILPPKSDGIRLGDLKGFMMRMVPIEAGKRYWFFTQVQRKGVARQTKLDG
jgi:hypothetical protein